MVNWLHVLSSNIYEILLSNSSHHPRSSCVLYCNIFFFQQNKNILIQSLNSFVFSFGTYMNIMQTLIFLSTTFSVIDVHTRMAKNHLKVYYFSLRLYLMIKRSCMHSNSNMSKNTWQKYLHACITYIFYENNLTVTYPWELREVLK